MAILGIDLGTSNSLVGYFDGEKAVLIPNTFNEVLTPSVVHIDNEGMIEVGKIAKQKLVTLPEQTASVFKRNMGTTKSYQLNGKSYSSIDLSAFVLKQLKEDAERFLNEGCEDAVISVPAYFNNKQRQATIDAARIAGLNVLRLISEPTAAALAHGITDFVDDAMIIVLDLGGGTFDVSILEMFDGVLQVMAIAGDNMLGGEDFTKVIVDDFCLKQGFEFEKQSKLIQSAIYDQCELIKRQLDKQSAFQVVFDKQVATYELDQQRYMTLCSDLFKRLRYPIIKALSDANIKANQVSEVILMGGSTKLPIVYDFAQTLFNRKPKIDLNPDETVAIGAILSIGLNHESAFEEMIMTDVCGFTLGVETSKQVDGQYTHGHFSPIIHRNATLPVSRIESYVSIHEKQDKINFKIYQGENRKADENIYLGNIEVRLPKRGANQCVSIRFTYDINGILEVETTVEKTGEVSSIVITDDACALTKEEIQAKLESYQKLKIHPQETQSYRLTKASLERLSEIAHGEIKYQIEQALDHLEQVSIRQNDFEMRKTLKDLDLFIERVEETLNQVFEQGDGGVLH